jgi:hypothetical protein
VRRGKLREKPKQLKDSLEEVSVKENIQYALACFLENEKEIETVTESAKSRFPAHI